MALDPETQFMLELMKVQASHRCSKKAIDTASRVAWAQGWPKNKVSFWNAESFLWDVKIEQSTKQLIEQELSSLAAGRNLDIGCGAHSYVHSLYGVDFSLKMLEKNTQCAYTLEYDIEQGLPSFAFLFDSITCVFVLNYIENVDLLLRDCMKLLADQGMLVVVLCASSVSSWHSQKVAHDMASSEWKQQLEHYFKVQFYAREGLWFFRCSKIELCHSSLL